MHALQTISPNHFRTKKEKIYLTIAIIVSFFIWAWILFLFTRQIISLFDSETTCYTKDQFNKNAIIKTKESLLLPGEKCITEDKLSEEDQKQIASENIESTIAGLITSPVILLLFFGGTLFTHLLAIAYIRMNALKVTKEQFPTLWEALQLQSKRLGMKKPPDMFIMLGNGLVNAFAIRLVSRKIIVITSELADALLEGTDQKQIEAVIGHEVGHHALGHTDLWNWLLIFGENVPFLYSALSRAREYSADRIMFAISDELLVSERALIKLAGGKTFGNKANINIYIEQAYDEKGFFSWLAEIIASHPHLPHRIIALRKLHERYHTNTNRNCSLGVTKR